MLIAAARSRDGGPLARGALEVPCDTFRVRVPSLDISPDTKLVQRAGLPQRSAIDSPALRRRQGEMDAGDLWRLAIEVGKRTCSATVQEWYTEQLAQRNSMVLVAFTEVAGELVPQAVVAAKRDEHHAEALYVDILCAHKGFGSAMLRACIELRRRGILMRAGGKTLVTLAALPAVLLYYPRFGFEYRASCASPAAAVPAALQKRLAKRAAKPHELPATTDAALEDADFAPLMQLLMEAKLGVTPDSVVDGFKMALCAAASAKPAAAVAARPVQPAASQPAGAAAPQPKRRRSPSPAPRARSKRPAAIEAWRSALAKIAKSTI